MSVNIANMFTGRHILIVGLPLFILYSFVADKLFEVLGIHTFPGADYILGWLFSFIVILKYFRQLRIDRRYLGIFVTMILYLILNCFCCEVVFNRYCLGFLFTFMFACMYLIYSGVEVSGNSVRKIFEILYCGLCILALVLLGIWIARRGEDIRNHSATPFQGMGVTGLAVNAAISIGFALYTMSRRSRYLLVNVFFSLIIVALALKKSLFTCCLYWGLFSFLNKKKQVLFISALVFVIGVCVLCYREELLTAMDTYYDQYDRLGVDGVARLKMLTTAYQIAKDYFPFGSGLGTYCSIPSLQMPYSEVYFDYGFHKLGVLSPYQKDISGRLYLLDTYWAHIIGELGFLGTLLFLTLWFYPVTITVSGLNNNSFYKKGLAIFVLSVCLSLTIEGFAIFAPENISFIMINGALVGLACRAYLSSSTKNEPSMCRVATKHG